MRWLRASALVLGVMMASPLPALARSERTLAYPRDQAWPAAVRFLVVDERLKVTDKDAAAGYALFELRDEGKTFRGSLELIATVADGRPVVRFVISIEDRPSWLEIGMLNRLERKLRLELGSPAPAPSRPAPGPGAPPSKDAPPSPGPGPAPAHPPAPPPPPPPKEMPPNETGGLPISPTP